MATLDKDQLGDNTDRTFRPVDPVRSGDQYVAEAVKGMADITGNLIKGYAVSETIKERDATVEAYARLRKVGAEGDPNALFDGASDRVSRIGAEMVGQLKGEFGSIQNAMKQGKIGPEIAYAKMEKIVAERIKTFPGFAEDINNAVSPYLGFNTQGWAARRILGVGEEDVQRKDPGMDALQKRVIDVWTEIAKRHGDQSLASSGWSLDAAVNDPHKFIEASNALYGQVTLIQRLEDAVNVQTAQGKFTATALAPLFREKVAGLSYTYAMNVGSVLSTFEKNRNNPAWIRENGPKNIMALRKDLAQMRMNAEAYLTSGLDPATLRMLDGDSLKSATGEMEKQIDAALKFLDTVGNGDNWESIAQVGSFFRRNDFFAAAPRWSLINDVFGNTTAGLAFNSLVGQQAPGQLYDELSSFGVTTGVNAASDAMVNQSETLGQMFEAAAKGPAAGRRWWQAVPNEKWDTTVDQTFGGIGNLVTQLSRKGTLDAKDDKAVEVALASIETAFELDGKEDRPTYMWPSTIAKKLDNIAGDAVLSKFPEGSTKEKLKAFRERAMRQMYIQLKALPNKSSSIGYNENNASNGYKAIIPWHGKAVPLEQVLFAPGSYDPNPELFTRNPDGTYNEQIKMSFSGQVSAEANQDLLKRLGTFIKFYNDSYREMKRFLPKGNK